MDALFLESTWIHPSKAAHLARWLILADLRISETCASDEMVDTTKTYWPRPPRWLNQAAITKNQVSIITKHS